jgi:ADP-ribosylglycohydrolase
MGESWQEAAPDLFAGQGSYGNGAAMRVAPLGAYFADDIKKVIQQAELSAVVTHSHPEAIAGAIATALAAAWAWQLANDKILLNRADFLDLILPSVPKSEVSRKIRKARDMDKTASVEFAVSVLGNGSLISAQDTVPFTLWCAGTHLNNYEEALWLTLSGQGDRDTTCAIVGGIVALYTGKEAIPNHWLNAREALPSWPFIETITLS